MEKHYPPLVLPLIRYFRCSLIFLLLLPLYRTGVIIPFPQCHCFCRLIGAETERIVSGSMDAAEPQPHFRGRGRDQVRRQRVVKVTSECCLFVQEGIQRQEAISRAMAPRYHWLNQRCNACCCCQGCRPSQSRLQGATHNPLLSLCLTLALPRSISLSLCLNLAAIEVQHSIYCTVDPHCSPSRVSCNSTAAFTLWPLQLPPSRLLFSLSAPSGLILSFLLLMMFGGETGHRAAC